MSGPKTQTTASAAWHARAEELAGWAMRQLVNRTDRAGGYYAAGGKTLPVTRPEKAPAGGFKPGYLTLARLARHFRATEPAPVVGVHSLGPDSVGKWCGSDIDAHDDAADPDANRAFALHGCAEAHRNGLCPLLYESNGKAGFTY